MPWPTLLDHPARLPANPDLAEGYAGLLQVLGPATRACAWKNSRRLP